MNLSSFLYKKIIVSTRPSSLAAPSMRASCSGLQPFLRLGLLPLARQNSPDLLFARGMDSYRLLEHFKWVWLCWKYARAFGRCRGSGPPRRMVVSTRIQYIAWRMELSKLRHAQAFRPHWARTVTLAWELPLDYTTYPDVQIWLRWTEDPAFHPTFRSCRGTCRNTIFVSRHRGTCAVPRFV